MTIWLVIYQTNAGFVYGWLCKAHRASDAETEFWRAAVVPEHTTIRCIAQLESAIVDVYFSLYELKE